MTGRSIAGSDSLLLLLEGVVGLLNSTGSDLLLNCVISYLLAGVIGSKSQELVLGNDPMIVIAMIQLVWGGVYVIVVTYVTGCHGYRQLLELQKLRRRAKKVVDTKASKGRKIRSVVQA